LTTYFQCIIIDSKNLAGCNHYLPEQAKRRMIMKRKPLNMKSKMGVCLLMFAFLLLPISANISMAAEEAVATDKEGAKVAQTESGAGQAAAGAAATGAAAGLGAGAIIAIAVGAVAAAVALGSAVSGDDAVSPTTLHP
jgi:hypothetical protein